MYFKTQWCSYNFKVYRITDLDFLTYKYRFVSWNDFEIDINPKKCIVSVALSFEHLKWDLNTMKFLELANNRAHTKQDKMAIVGKVWDFPLFFNVIENSSQCYISGHVPVKFS